MYFFFHDTATTEIYTLSLHDALPIYNLMNDDEFRKVVDEVEAHIRREAGSVGGLSVNNSQKRDSSCFHEEQGDAIACSMNAESTAIPAYATVK